MITPESVRVSGVSRTEQIAADPNRVIVFDTTMRDGEQAPGFSMSAQAKVKMAQVLTDLGVDVIELLTGEDPHLSGYSLTRAAEGLSIKRRAGFEYLHKAPHFKNKLAEPFLVTAPYLEEEQDAPIHLSYHKGQELDYIISGRMRFAYEDHIEELEAGDLLMYDSSRGHGMIATGGEPCTFLAVVMKPNGEII